MRDTWTGFGWGLREFNDESDRGPLLVKFPPKAALSWLVNCLKGGGLAADAVGILGFRRHSWRTNRPAARLFRCRARTPRSRTAATGPKGSAPALAVSA